MSWLKLVEAPVKAKVTKVSPDGKKLSINTGPGRELNIDLDKAPEVDVSTDMGQTTIKLNKKKGPNVGPKVRPGQQVNVQEDEKPSYEKWDHPEAVDYAKHLEKTFGSPDEFTNEQVVWHNKDGFKRIVCRDEYILHTSPAPHYDFVYSYVDLEVPESLSDELAKCSGSILIDHLKNEVGARCGSLSANATTINFVMDVVAGRAEPIKENYEKRILDMIDMNEKGKHYKLDWWPDETGDADPKNPYYAESINEGPNDPNIFKAVFMAGGPGSGKSYVADKLLRGRGLKNSNPDVMFEILLKKAELKPTPDDIGSEKGQAVRDRAKAVTNNQLETWIDGRLGLIIDGTGKEPAKIAKTSEMLQDLGYETMMLFVNTSLEVAQQRNRQRERSIPDRMVTNMWNMVQDNIMKFQQIFKTGNFTVVDNSGGLEDPERKDNFARVSKDIDKFLAQPVTSRKAKAWLDSKRPQ